jgi:hypothetical protein
MPTPPVTTARPAQPRQRLGVLPDRHLGPPRSEHRANPPATNTRAGAITSGTGRPNSTAAVARAVASMS